MPFSAQPPASGERYALSASLDNARHLSSLLRAVHFQDHATCLATANGLRVTVEDAKCIQANAFIQVPEHGRGEGAAAADPAQAPVTAAVRALGGQGVTGQGPAEATKMSKGLQHLL